MPMPAAVVLIVCKVAVAGPPDQNAEWTGAQNLEWATEHSKMVCRRLEVQLYDSAEANGADPKPFTLNDCQKAGITLGAQWDAGHRSSKYRFWRVACPVPTVNTETGEIIAWTLPDCGKRDVVICESDTAI